MPNNQILSVRVRERLLNPAEAELWVTVEADSGAHRVWVRLEHLKQEMEVAG